MAVVAVLAVAAAARAHVDLSGRVGRLVTTSAVATAVTRHLLVTGVIVIVVEAVAHRRRRRAGARAADEVAQAVPELVDLFRLAAAAGLAVPSALSAVAERAPPPVRHQLSQAVGSVRRGLPLDESLRRLATGLGPSGGSLVATLRHSAATGVALAPALAELATRARSERRAEARAAIGRLTVTMVLPLVCCILPAAVMVAVVPVVIVSLAALGD
jgi:pilus assembly protein TadC